MKQGHTGKDIMVISVKWLGFYHDRQSVRILSSEFGVSEVSFYTLVVGSEKESLSTKEVGNRSLKLKSADYIAKVNNIEIIDLMNIQIDNYLVQTMYDVIDFQTHLLYIV